MEVHISPPRISRHGPTGLPEDGYPEATDGGVTLVLVGSDWPKLGAGDGVNIEPFAHVKESAVALEIAPIALRGTAALIVFVVIKKVNKL